jgi:pseudaminic acid synthase
MSKVFIIAELSGNHNQSIRIAKKSILSIKESGADAVKLQTYLPESLTFDLHNKEFGPRKKGLWKGERPYDVFAKGALPYEWHDELFNYAKSLGLICFSSPFDIEAVDFLEKLNNPIYKIASFEIGHIPLIEKISETKKPVIVSTGKANIKDIENLFNYFNHDLLTLLVCTSEYPAPVHLANLNSIKELNQKFKVKVGLSDHTLGINIPIAATALGAVVIEKHFILNRSLGGIDSEFSLEPKEFLKMVNGIREVSVATGKGLSQFNREPCMTRSIYVCSIVRTGDKVSNENIKIVRGVNGLHPKYYNKIIGKSFFKKKLPGTPLFLEDLS